MGASFKRPCGCKASAEDSTNKTAHILQQRRVRGTKHCNAVHRFGALRAAVLCVCGVRRTKFLAMPSATREVTVSRKTTMTAGLTQRSRLTQLAITSSLVCSARHGSYDSTQKSRVQPLHVS